MATGLVLAGLVTTVTTLAFSAGLGECTIELFTLVV